MRELEVSQKDFYEVSSLKK